jgi:mannose-6-phosphate isomerase-like protein (cupin superfamily)
MKLPYWIAVAGLFPALTAVGAETPRPQVVITHPGDIKWSGPSGTKRASMVYGNNNGGKIILITDWPSGSIAHAHYHQRDRTFVVLKGHWDIATDTKDDPATMKVVPQGSIVNVPAGAVFKDGCKKAPCLILTIGESGDPSTYIGKNGKDVPASPAR